MKNRFIFFASLSLIFLSAGCVTTTSRNVIATQGGGPGELWLVTIKQKVTDSLVAKVHHGPVYEIYYCRPEEGCKKVGELKKSDVKVDVKVPRVSKTPPPGLPPSAKVVGQVSK